MVAEVAAAGGAEAVAEVAEVVIEPGRSEGGRPVSRCSIAGACRKLLSVFAACMHAAVIAHVLQCAAPSWANDPVEHGNINDLAADAVPSVVFGEPMAGRRTFAVTTGWEETDVRHVISLPKDWRPGQSYPLLVEFPGNGGYRNDLGDVSDGTPESCVLGHGLGADGGFLWVSLPFVEVTVDGSRRNCLRWWGDVDETKRYCIATVRDVCSRFGGDDSRVVLCGFSRGAIACNYIGLHDDTIASLWCGFFCHSHYDGVRQWPYPGSDAPAAARRLSRLAGRPQWISHELDVAPTEAFIDASGVSGAFTFVAIPYPNHTAAWVLRQIPERARARAWLRQIVERDD